MGNSIQELPNGDILASYRPTSTVIPIDRKTGNILWKLPSTIPSAKYSCSGDANWHRQKLSQQFARATGAAIKPVLLLQQ
jgi:hypothetical protein